MKQIAVQCKAVGEIRLCFCCFVCLGLPCYCLLLLLQGSGEQAIGTKHFHEALKAVRPSCLRSSLGRTEVTPTSWAQIGGLDEVKLKLRQVREHKAPERVHAQRERQENTDIFPSCV